VQAALAAMRNKTDRNDARGIAQILRTGQTREPTPIVSVPTEDIAELAKVGLLYVRQMPKPPKSI